jgi:hypothetical protein
MQRYFHEIFADFSKLKTKDERINFLRRHDSITLRRIVKAAFHPGIKFFITHVPAAYKPNPNMRNGMHDRTLEQAMNKIYLFEISNPRTPRLTYKKRESLLIESLETLAPDEAKIFLDLLFKTLDVRYLTASLVREVWPGLIPPHDEIVLK